MHSDWTGCHWCYSKQALYPRAAWWSRWCCCRGRSRVHFELWSGRRRWSRGSESWRSLCWSHCTHSLRCPHLNPEGTQRKDMLWRLLLCISCAACLHVYSLWVYLVIVSKLVLQDVSIGPVRLRPRESDGVWGSAQLVHHGNCAGNCGRGQMIKLTPSSNNNKTVKLCWSDQKGAVLQSLSRIFSRAWKWRFYGAPSRI